jgi:hypothetical protein
MKASTFAMDLMKPSNVTRFLLVFVFSFFLTGCVELMELGMPRSHDRNLGRIDLSSKGSRCEGVFRWNSHEPSLELLLLGANARGRPLGSNPVMLLVIQLDIFDQDKLVMSSQLGRNQVECPYERSWSGGPRLVLARESNSFKVLQAGHSYKFVLTVLQEEKDLGSADVYMYWSSGGSWGFRC